MQDNKKNKAKPVKDKNEIEKLIITISKEDERDELFDILLHEGKLPFKLPSHVMFPSGKKEFARRAKMLMLAGIDFLKEKYPYKESKPDEKLSEKDKKNLVNF